MAAISFSVAAAGNDGGGIFSSGTMTLADSTIESNTALGFGGGIFNSGTANVISSTVAYNTTIYGGGVFNSGRITITNSTISGNITYPPSSSYYYTYSSGEVDGSTGISATLQGSIVANSTGVPDLYGTISGNHNLIDDYSFNSLSGTNNLWAAADLESLGNYGGPTQTMPPAPGSPAIAEGAGFNDQDGNPIESDQRGLPMPTTVTPDIGAVQTSDGTTVPLAPSGLGTTVASSTEIDLGWTDHAASSVGDVIYQSTDNGSTFYPIDEINSVSAGSTNSYQATGLNPGSHYEFYVITDGGYLQSPASGTAGANTTFVAPTLDVEGTGTVVEGQPYELDLTATYPDGEPGVINHWAVDWHDGAGGASHVVNYSYPPGADPTQPLVVTYVFASGIASPTVTITAVDSVNGSFSADDQPVTVMPIAPASAPGVSFSNSTLTVDWVNSSSISTGTTILLSTDDVAFFEAGSAAAGATSTTISNLTLDTQYWVKVLTEGANGESDETAASPISTPYVQPTLVVTPLCAPIEGQTYEMNLSATYPANTPASDMISDWTVNWGDGRPTQDYGAAGGNVSDYSYSASTVTANIVVTAVITGHSDVTSSSTIDFSPNQPGGVGGYFTSSGSVGVVTWNGQTSIASDYIVQRLDPGGSGGWQTIKDVAATADGAQHPYSYNDFPLNGSLIGGDGGYLYRIGAKTNQATSDAPGTPGVSQYTSAFTLVSNPDISTGEVAYDYPGTGDTQSGVNGSWTTSPYDSPGVLHEFQSGDSTTLTVSNLPPHISLTMDLFGYSDFIGAYGDSRDNITLTGEYGGSAWQGPTPAIDLEVTTPDLDQSSVSFTVNGLVYGTGRSWEITGATISLDVGTVSLTGPLVDVGGTVDWPVQLTAPGVSDYSSLTLRPVAYDPSVIQISPSTVDLTAGGTGFIHITGVGPGYSPITLQDLIGDQAYPGPVILSGAPTVGSTGTVTQGVVDNTNGFTFSVPYTSTTPVQINFNTSGSTLPSGLMTALSSGSVTIPATTNPDDPQTSVFVPFNVPEDNNIAPARTAVVNVSVPGVAYYASPQAKINVLNTDKPGITIDGQQDGADVTVDPTDEDNASLLASVACSATWDGNLDSTIFNWNPSQDIIWPTQTIGTVGTDDLASMPGVVSTIYGDFYTFKGIVPTQLLAQAAGGSAAVDNTSMTLEANVWKAATQFVANAFGSASKSANETQKGLVLVYNGSVASAKFGGNKVPVGELVDASVEWLGPGSPFVPGAQISYQWTIDGIITHGFYASGSIGQSLPVTAADLLRSSVNFLWVDGLLQGSDRLVSCAVSTSLGFSGAAKAIFTTYRPAYKVNATTSFTTVTGHTGTGGVIFGYPSLSGGVDPPGIKFSIASGSVEPSPFSGGTIEWVQVVGYSESTYFERPGKAPFDVPPQSGLDNFYPLPPDTPTSISDSPEIGGVDPARFSEAADVIGATMYLLWKPPVANSDWVPLRSVKWSWSADIQYRVGRWVLIDSDVPLNPVPDSNSYDYPSWTTICTNG